MPSSAATNRPEDLMEKLGVCATDKQGEVLLKALREVKNQIIGNKTKKLLYLHLGAAAAAIGSFACGVEDGTRAVVEAGAVPHLIQILSHPDEKVVDAGVRSLRMIFQSKLAPKYDVLEAKNMKFLLSLLNSNTENLTEVAARIISHSCDKYEEQNVLCDAGALQRLVDLLEGSSSQREACLHALVAIARNNSDIATKFVQINNGRGLITLTDLMYDRHPQTRFLACKFLITLGQASSCHAQELQTKTKLILVLVELLEEPSQAGDDASFALLDLIAEKEDLHKQAMSINIIEKLCYYLENNSVSAKRLQGILLIIAEICSKLEICRCHLMSLQVLNALMDAVKHESADVRIAACKCIKNIFRSIKNLSADCLSNDAVVLSLIQLLQDSFTSIQDAALGAICNVVVAFKAKRSPLIKFGGVTQLVQLSKSMDSSVRLKSVWALRNLMFIADRADKEFIIYELTLSSLAILIRDSENLIQEQAMALVCNLVAGSADYIKYAFAEECVILNAVIRQLKSNCATPVCVQGMFLLANIAAGDEFHKEAVLSAVIPSQEDGCTASFIIRFMQSKDHFLRTASVWCILNLTNPVGENSSLRIRRLQDARILPQIKLMVNDPWLDCKFRVRTVLEQCMSNENMQKLSCS
ncbi:hypothetical protein HPP92_020382 [Vanilla planifolia]|uniref:Armadillo repeat-containing protein 8 n=1 Tax=Vanilla planifolia TaxID=51239 RepID=A0A835Q8C7_VANPL|nr:hypothetical protein HPP92_020382 [Vanilla planifolia]